jgi:hypothetical protein
MDMENIIIPLEQFTKVNGKQIFNMGKVLSNFQIKLLIRANFKKERSVVSEFLNSLMDLNTKGN